jgi:hypothetical protein
MAQRTSFGKIVSTVRNAFDPRIDPRILTAIEEFRISVDSHNKCSTPSHLENRKQAFAKIQQLHKEVRSRIDTEVAKHVNLSALEPHGLEKEKIFWAVMENEGELDAGNPSGSTQTNPLNLRSILAPVAETRIAHEPQPKMGFRHCPYPRCNWKIENCKKTWSLFQNHMQVDHQTERFRCEAGCTKNFPSKKIAMRTRSICTASRWIDAVYENQSRKLPSEVANLANEIHKRDAD